MGLLAALGVVPAARYEAVAERLRKSESRVENLTRKLEDVSRKLEAVEAESQRHRAKAEQAQKQLKQMESEAARDAQQFQKFKTESERELARQKKRTVDVPGLQARLDDFERDLVVTRGHLMSIEVKLDILEGAASVLDRRTRSVLSELPSPGGNVTA